MLHTFRGRGLVGTRPVVPRVEPGAMMFAPFGGREPPRGSACKPGENPRDKSEYPITNKNIQFSSAASSRWPGFALDSRFRGDDDRMGDR